MIGADDVARARDRLARLEAFIRRYADQLGTGEFGTGWVHDLADQIGETRQDLREIAAVPRCLCGERLPAASGRGPMRRYCSPRCRKRASRAL